MVHQGIRPPLCCCEVAINFVVMARDKNARFYFSHKRASGRDWLKGLVLIGAREVERAKC